MCLKKEEMTDFVTSVRSVKVKPGITFAFCNMEVIDLSKNGYGLVLRVEVRLEQKVRNWR